MSVFWGLLTLLIAGFMGLEKPSEIDSDSEYEDDPGNPLALLENDRGEE